jgi:light-regulated signal transduction histidine kinase (bacteriophytochrome)
MVRIHWRNPGANGWFALAIGARSRDSAGRASKMERGSLRGTTFDVELPLRGAHGGFRWFLTRVKPVSNAHGKFIRWFGTHTDIHDVRETREQLRRANIHLEQFAYSAAHDLQEPLRNVAIYSQLLKKRYELQLDQRGTEYVSFITEGATRMESLVRDLLSYAESGTAPDEPVAPVDSAAVLKDVLAATRSSIGESGAEITQGYLPVLKVRSVHMRQLFQNLLGNAIKYRSKRKLRIQFDATVQGSEWIFSVRDNGMGIEPEYLDKVFGLFKRLNGSRYSGTGLGRFGSLPQYRYTLWRANLGRFRIRRGLHIQVYTAARLR